MNILLVTDSYPPEIRSISGMMKELADELTLRGHEVTVVTSWPKYNLAGQATKQHFYEFSKENNVKIIRAKTLPHHKVNFILRGVSELLLPFLYFKKVKKYMTKQFDVVFVYSPPLTMSILGTKIKKLCQAKYILNIQDIFPQNAIDLGIIKNKIIIKFFERIEHKAYKNADIVTSHTESGRKFLIDNKSISPENIFTVPNWIDINDYESRKPTHLYRKQYGLEDRFIFLFAGIMGPSQNLDFIIDIAGKIVDIPQICFLLVGGGTERKRLQKKTELFGLKNVVFGSFVAPDEYPSLVSEADVGLICLSNKNKTPVIPGKILGFMAASIPVVAFLNQKNEGHRQIREANCGYSAISEDLDVAASLIRKMYNERDNLYKYGRNGHDYAINLFCKSTCIDKIEKLLIISQSCQ